MQSYEKISIYTNFFTFLSIKNGICGKKCKNCGICATKICVFQKKSVTLPLNLCICVLVYEKLYNMYGFVVAIAIADSGDG